MGDKTFVCASIEQNIIITIIYEKRTSNHVGIVSGFPGANNKCSCVSPGLQLQAIFLEMAFLAAVVAPLVGWLVGRLILLGWC